MEKKRFNLINRIVSIAVLAASSIVYLATIEPTVSFWDCGEFIASSYKLEVGHPPGNPVFNLFARFFTMFTDNMHAAVAVNAMSALCSALTIFFLYLTIVHFGRRLNEKRGRELTLGNALGLFGAGVVGAMAYCFSDTFWFSAVEGEVYAMSSLFTAIVFWAILKWEEQADEPYANRWLVLISLLMGLSVGVHLLNLLTIPPIVFIVYYKKHDGKITFRRAFGVLMLSAVILAVILFGIIPYLPKLTAFVDRIFVNGFGAKFNVGATIFMLLLLAGCFFALRLLRKKEKAILHTGVLCFTAIIIGYSTFAMVIIRSCANTPTNEYQPDNPYTLVRYLGREQYGSTPLLYGQAFTSPYDIEEIEYYTPLGEHYHKADNISPVYPAGSKMLFPRMWSSSPDNRIKSFYESYMTSPKSKSAQVRGKNVQFKMPSFTDNLRFFFDYQVNYMYIRYFMWNFVGRQNDFHGQVPGDLMNGNWESGIKFIDDIRLGDQSSGPDIMVHNKGKNHYFFLPLILGLIGFFFQLKHDGRNTWVTALLFLLTGLAIVVYLNQPPYQVRERDYAYAGSFYAFALWIGLGVLAIQNWIEKSLKRENNTAIAALATALGLVVPAIMGAENWDDHDRSGRYTAHDLAYNHLQTCDPNAILVTHGDNDTFPLWYIQEVEGVRTDVRIVNTSLLGTDWYIDQLKCKQYDGEPLPITIDRKQYLYGTNDYPYVIDMVDRPVLASEAIDIFKNPKYVLSDGKTDFIPSKRLLIPVNKENVRKYGIVSEEDMDKVVDFVELKVSEDRFGKTDLIILDILAHYDWSRPIYFVTPNGDVDLNLTPWLQYNGYCYKFVPVYSPDNRSNPYIDAEKMYDKLMNVYKFESLACDNVNYDYQNIYTFCAVSPVREMFVSVAERLNDMGEEEKAVQLLDKVVAMMPASNFPYCLTWMRSINELSILRIVENYLIAGEVEKAKAVGEIYFEEHLKAIDWFITPINGFEDSILSKKLLDESLSMVYYLTSTFELAGEQEYASQLKKRISSAFETE